MRSDHCTGGTDASPYGNDDFIKGQIRSVITDNVVCILLIAVVVCVSGTILYYIWKTLSATLKEYNDHRGAEKMRDPGETGADGNEDEEEYADEPRLAEVPEVAAVRNRLGDIETKYKKYNVEISKLRDGDEDVVDTRIVSREADNYTHRPGKPERRVKV
jgi:uncharacterized membrane protein